MAKVTPALYIKGGYSGNAIARFERIYGVTPTTTYVDINGSGGNAQLTIASANNTFALGVNTTTSAFEISDSGAIGTNTRLLIDVNGNVGIGTTSPTGKLHVVETTATGSRIQLGTASTNALMNSGSTNDLLILNAPYGSDAATIPNAGAKWGIKFVGAVDGNLNSNNKTSAIYAVSEDTIGGYNRGTSLAFYTNQWNDQPYAERMRIYHNGNIGIGTTSPGYKLTIQNDAASTNALLGLQNFSTSATTNHGVSILPILSDNTGSTAITAGGLYWLKEQQWTNDTTSRDSYLRIDTTENGLASEKVRITSAGNVGIGTTNPNSARLHLYGPASFGATIRLTNTGTTGGDYFITSTDAGWNAGGNKLLIGNGTPASPNAKLILDSNGNVGIGVASPSGRLHITGSSTNGENLVYLSKGSGSIAQHYITAVNQNGVLNYRVTSDINGHAQQILYLAGTIHVYHDSYWSSYINNANYTQGGLALGTGSLTHGYGLTIARPSTSGSLYVSGSSIFTGSVNVNGSVTFSGPIIYDNAVLLDYGSASTPVVSTNYAVLQNLTGSYNSAFFDYFASSGSNFRAGTVIAGWSGSSINYTEYSTTDVGNTNELSMSVDLSGSFVRLLTRVSTTINWNIKSAGRYL